MRLKDKILADARWVKKRVYLRRVFLFVWRYLLLWLAEWAQRYSGVAMETLMAARAIKVPRQSNVSSMD